MQDGEGAVAALAQQMALTKASGDSVEFELTSVDAGAVRLAAEFQP